MKRSEAAEAPPLHRVGAIALLERRRKLSNGLLPAISGHPNVEHESLDCRRPKLRDQKTIEMVN
jgi:hypothetical protein